MDDDRIATELHRLARQAPPISAIDTASLVRELRRKRRTKSVIATAGSALVASGAVLIGVQVGSTDETPGQQTMPGRGVRVVTSGSTCADRTATVDEHAQLKMTSNIPTEADLSNGGILRRAVRFTNEGSSRFLAMTGRNPDIYVVQDDKVVARPLGKRSSAHTVDLSPGGTMTVQAGVNLRHCADVGDGGSNSSRTDGPSATLSPGDYELYATQTFTVYSDAHPDGVQVQVRGGPWPLSLR